MPSLPASAFPGSPSSRCGDPRVLVGAASHRARHPDLRVGGNPAAARLSGIKVWRVLLFVYAVSGLLAGLGGVMSAARLFAANGLQLGQSTSSMPSPQ